MTMPLDAREPGQLVPVEDGESTVSPSAIRELIEQSNGCEYFFPREKTWNGNKFPVGGLSGFTVSTLLFDVSRVNKVALLASLQRVYHSYGKSAVPFFADAFLDRGHAGEVIDCTDVSGLGKGLGTRLDSSTPQVLLDARKQALNALLDAPYESTTALSLDLSAYENELDNAYESGRNEKKAIVDKRARAEVPEVSQDVVEVLYEGIEQKWAQAGIDFQDKRLRRLNKSRW